MDRELRDRWLGGHSPFDEAILRCEDLVPLAVLQPAVQAVVQLLLVPDYRLYTFDDWHEHDGYVSSPSSLAWDELRAMVSTEAAIFAARHGDTYVRRAFYPESIAWLLRFYVLDADEDEEYPGIWGSFDLSGSRDLCERARNTIGRDGTVILDNAKDYFDGAHSG